MRFIFRKFFLILLTLFSAHYLRAQTDSSLATKPGLVVIPFEPLNYFCNGDQFLCATNHLTPGELNQKIVESVQQSMLDKMSGYFHVDGCVGKAGQSGSELSNIYSVTKYRMLNQPLNAYYVYDPKKNGKNKLFATQAKVGSEELGNNNAELASATQHRYFRAEFQNDSMIKQIVEGYGAKYILFVDHFEMQTRYQECHDMAKSIFQRDIYFHYTFLSKDGKLIDGGVAAMTYNNYESDSYEALEKHFDTLSQMVADRIWAKLKS